ncbi:stomatal closure-related actin-binding protein 1 [Iris pallida]|uniref:Stomatal closure-related actin-binding protein 1 n=1 Tax=Iris pallida TaxID=29817 RepID=A0AAX6EBK4_IRIPA|nr:stomatal closure-related actin-binding protein 1 [Iris pallida]
MASAASSSSRSNLDGKPIKAMTICMIGAGGLHRLVPVREEHERDPAHGAGARRLQRQDSPPPRRRRDGRQHGRRVGWAPRATARGQ